MAGSIVEKWWEIMGSNQWDCLLDPLDIDVRQNLLIYCDLVKVTDDAFNNEPVSKNQGRCRYSKNDLFENKRLMKGNQYKYQVTEFFDTPTKALWFEEKNWMGYVAAWAALHGCLSAVSSLLEKYKNKEMRITVTGHSLGAALATLNAADIASNGLNKPKDLPNKSCPVTAIVLASPRVGDDDFKKAFTSLQDLRLLRIRNNGDIVPRLPLFFAEVGEELLVDASKSTYLKNASQNLHNLQVYLHGIAGTQGKDDFKLVVKRDLALINQGIGGLLDNKGIAPVSWWIEKNKGMVQYDDGSWQLHDYEGEDGGEN